jgi:hypothetical protein
MATNLAQMLIRLDVRFGSFATEASRLSAEQCPLLVQ